MDLQRLSEYVARDIKAKELDAEAKRLKAQNAKIEEQLIDGMIDAGIENMKIGDRTVFIRSQLWASAADAINPLTGEVDGKDWPTTLHALAEHGYGDLKEERVNAQRLSALVRELNDTEDGVPESLAECLTITDKVKLVVRK